MVIHKIEGRTAELIGNADTVSVRVVNGLNRIAFIEITPYGAVQTITVYYLAEVKGGFKSVYSRNTAPGGVRLIPSIMTGNCKLIKDK